MAAGDTNVCLGPISQVIIGSKMDDHYKIKVTMFNPSSEKLLATVLLITLSLEEDPQPCGEGLSYILSDEIIVSAVEEGELEFVTDFTLDSDKDLAGYEFPAKGVFYPPNSSRCASELELVLETSFIISPNEYTSFYIHIPQKISVERAKYGDVPYQRFPPVIDIPSLTNSDVLLLINTDKTDPISYSGYQ